MDAVATALSRFVVEAGLAAAEVLGLEDDLLGAGLAALGGSDGESGD